MSDFDKAFAELCSRRYLIHQVILEEEKQREIIQEQHQNLQKKHKALQDSLAEKYETMRKLKFKRTEIITDNTECHTFTELKNVEEAKESDKSSSLHTVSSSSLHTVESQKEADFEPISPTKLENHGEQSMSFSHVDEKNNLLDSTAPSPNIQNALQMKLGQKVQIKKNVIEMKVVLQKRIQQNMEDWLETPLTDKEVQEAEKRIQEFYPLGQINIEELFPTLKMFQSCLNYYRYGKQPPAPDKSLKYRRGTGRWYTVYAVKGEGLDCNLEAQAIVSQDSEQSQDEGEARKPIKAAQVFIENEKQKLLELPELTEQQLNRECNKLHSIVKSLNKTYEGTDPIQDAQFFHKNQMLAKFYQESYQTVDSKKGKGIFNNFGHGINSYFNLIETMIKCFIILWILACPLQVIYTLEGQNSLQHMGFVRTLGLLGAASHNCLSSLIVSTQDMYLSCLSGRITNLKHHGIIPDAPLDFAKDFCGDPSKFEQTKNCMEDSTLLRSHFDSQCRGEQECYLSVIDFIGENNPCRSGNAQVYVQWQCERVEDIPGQFHEKVLSIIMLTMLICIFYRFVLYFLAVNAQMDEKTWDIQTVTTADFAIQIRIPDQVWLNWIHSPERLIQKMTFKTLMIKELEKQIESLSSCLHEHDHKNDEYEIKVASIHFAYDNKELIFLLKERGQYLSEGQFQKHKEVSDQIDKLIEENKEKFSKPVVAFVIFDNQECQERCLDQLSTTKTMFGKVEYNESGKAFTMLDERLELEEVSEPSDIIWENLSQPQKNIGKNMIKVYCLMLTFLLFQLYVLTIMKNLSMNKDKGFQPIRDQFLCRFYEKSQASDEEKMFNAQVVKEKKLYHMDDYTCYCYEKGFSIGAYGTYFKKQLNIATKAETDDLCWDFINITIHRSGLGNIFSFVVIVTNQFVINISIYLVKRIGLHTQSEETLNICFLVFFGQFVNSTLLILLSNASFRGTPLEFLNQMGIDGPYNHINSKWYQDVGSQIVLTQMSQAALPFYNAFKVIFIAWMKKIMDRGCKRNAKTTTKTIQQYIATYAGSEVRMYTGYAVLMNSCLVSFTFGTAVPILYPITVFTLFNHYCMEKILFAYYYRQPPMYGNQINDGCLKILTLGPILMMCFNFWSFGNREIFSNLSNPMDFKTKGAEVQQHKLLEIGEGVNYIDTVMFLIFIPFFLLFTKVVKALRYAGQLLNLWKEMEGMDLDFNIEVKVDEYLGIYWDCLKGQSQLRWYSKELHQQTNLGIVQLEQYGLEKLRVSQRKARTILNLTINYDILENDRYLDDFFYLQMDRREENPISDFVAKALYLGEMR